jgi:ketosteroid isomerase-like protein
MKVCVALILLCAAIFSRAGTAADNASAERAIRASLGQWTDAANRGDYQTALQVWAPDLVGWPAEGADDTYAREAEFAALPAQPQKTTYALQINEIIVDGSIAVVRDTWTQTTRGDGGDDKIETFRSFEVWRRQADASWKISRWIDGPMRHPPGK